MQNLLTKLDAGTRKQVVQRARILRLLEASALHPLHREQGADPPSLLKFVSIGVRCRQEAGAALRRRLDDRFEAEALTHLQPTDN